jgi:hypothetical protein
LNWESSNEEFRPLNLRRYCLCLTMFCLNIKTFKIQKRLKVFYSQSKFEIKMQGIYPGS